MGRLRHHTRPPHAGPGPCPLAPIALADSLADSLVLQVPLRSVRQGQSQILLECLIKETPSALDALALALQVSLRSVREGRTQTLLECLIKETRLSFRCVEQTTSHDFFEGVRALLVDKDNSPKVLYSTVQYSCTVMLHVVQGSTVQFPRYSTVQLYCTVLYRAVQDSSKLDPVWGRRRPPTTSWRGLGPSSSRRTTAPRWCTQLHCTVLFIALYAALHSTVTHFFWFLSICAVRSSLLRPWGR